MVNTSTSVASVHAVARRFGLSVSWLKSEATAGRIPCLKAGKHLLFNLDAVEEALARRAAAGSIPGKGGEHAS